MPVQRVGAGVADDIRAGIARDESPVPNVVLRTPRVPDSDRTWLTLGASYAYSKSYSVDIGYAHLFVSVPRLSKAAGIDPDQPK